MSWLSKTVFKTCRPENCQVPSLPSPRWTSTMAWHCPSSLECNSPTLQTIGNGISVGRRDVFLLGGNRPSPAIQQTGKVRVGPVRSDGKSPAKTHNRERTTETSAPKREGSYTTDRLQSTQQANVAPASQESTSVVQACLHESECDVELYRFVFWWCCPVGARWFRRLIVLDWFSFQLLFSFISLRQRKKKQTNKRTRRRCFWRNFATERKSFSNKFVSSLPQRLIAC